MKGEAMAVLQIDAALHTCLGLKARNIIATESREVAVV
jgi:hypothetical protein